MSALRLLLAAFCAYSAAAAELSEQDLVDLGIKRADISNIEYSCDKMEHEPLCAKTGFPSQFTLRWYHDGSRCIPYPFGYCMGETEVATHPSIKTLAACEEICG